MNWELSFCIVGSIWAISAMVKTLRQYDIEKMAQAIIDLENEMKKLK